MSFWQILGRLAISNDGETIQRVSDETYVSNTGVTYTQMGPTPVGKDSSVCISAGNRRSLALLNKCVESDQHQEKGHRPCQPAYSGKVDKGCGLRTTKRGKARLTGFLHGRSRFSWFGQPNDRGDLFQIAAPAIKALPLNRRFVCVSSTAAPVIWQSL